ncbi:S-layer homology domain-containing protein [Cohnella fermenti]|uniref:S-layer homology domain-containing protein n=1 Tax=Cohnella fermenti TaxID=2565925 RepID=A0A4S4C632_9BACL|nr:S-layer homology domain-containing protein [Cohnella fermenti]THF83310.1 S-layer homology domain-containing protein [Cohnella fermenti]
MNRFVAQCTAALLAFAMLLGLSPLSALAADPTETQTYSKSFQPVAGRAIAATISTTDAVFGAKLAAAADDALVGTIASTADSNYLAAKALFEQDYTLSGDFELISWALTLDGQTVTELPEGTTIAYSNYEVVSGTGNASVFASHSGTLAAVPGVNIIDFLNLGMIFQADFTLSSLDSTIIIANDKFTPKTVTRAYEDGLEYFSVAVTGSSAELPSSGSVQVSNVENNSQEWADIQQLLQARYNGTLNFSVHDLALHSGVNEIPLPEQAQATVTVRLATIAGDPYIYQYANGSLTKLTAAKSDAGSAGAANYSFRTDGLSGIVLLSSSGLTEKINAYTRTYSDASGMFTAAVTSSTAGALPETGTLDMRMDTDAGQTQAIRKLLGAKYSGTLNFAVYDAVLLNDQNEEVAWPSDAESVVTAKTYQTTPFVFTYADGKLTKLATANAGSGTIYDYTFQTKNLDNLVILNSSGVTVNRFSDFAAGTYRITANLYVKGENNEVLPGVTAYLTNPDLPPVKAMENNAIMTVDEYGDLTLTIDVKNGIFSLQHIEDGEDVHIVDSTYGADEGATAGIWGPYTGRIMQLVVAVDNLNEEYAFTNALEYPTILEMEKTMPVHLGVDFSSATRMLDGDGESTTFTDEATGAAVTLQTTDSQLAGTLGAAKLSVTELTEGDSYEAARAALTKEYVDEPAFKLYDIRLLTAEGQEIAFSWSEALAVTLPLGDGVTNGEVSAVANGSATKLSATAGENSLSFEGVSSLGQFAVVDKNSIPAWVQATAIDAESGITLKAYSIDSDIPQEGKTLGMFSERTKSLFSMLASQETEGDSFATALQGLTASEQTEESEQTDLLNPVVEKTYRIAIVNTVLLGVIDMMEASKPDSGASWQVWRGQMDAFIQAIVPAADKDSRFYLITSDGAAAKALELGAVIQNGVATIDLMPRSLSAEEGVARMFSLYWGQRGVQATTTRPISYVVAVKNLVAEQPAAVTGLTANGSEQTGVAEGVGYTLTGNKATEAGDYTAVATLTAGYMWSDGTTAPLSIPWTIAAQSTGGTGGNGSGPVTKTVTANLYVPGSLNTQLPGITAYLTNGSNPQGIGGYPKQAPTTPVANNAQLTTDTDGKMTLVLNIPNPVFTLQKLDGSSNARVVATKRDSAAYGSYTGRITQVTVELLDNSGTYVFSDSVEYPTLLGIEWFVPLTLSVNFEGGDSGLPSAGNVDVGDLAGEPEGEEGTEETTTADGTVITKVTQSDGSVLISMKTKNGSTSETSVSAGGKSTTTIVLSEQEAAGIKAGAALPLPMPSVVVTNRLDTAASFTLTSLGSDSVASLLVSVPASKVTPGTVVVMVKEDGTTQVVAGTKYNDGTISFTAEKNVTYKLVDNGKSFTDVAADSWYADAVQYMSAREWMQGTSDGFSPNDSTSRGMIVTMLHRMAGLPAASAGSHSFTDVASGKYYAEAAAWAGEQGLANGYSDGSFGADDPITREQLAVILWRYAGSPSGSDGLNGFADRDRASGYAAEALAWAVEKGMLSGKGNGILDPQGQATRSQTAKILMSFMEAQSAEPAQSTEQ